VNLAFGLYRPRKKPLAIHNLTPAAKAAIQKKAFIAALKRCATPKSINRSTFSAAC
jgi:hypothetical protein